MNTDDEGKGGEQVIEGRKGREQAPVSLALLHSKTGGSIP